MPGEAGDMGQGAAVFHLLPNRMTCSKGRLQKQHLFSISHSIPNLCSIPCSPQQHHRTELPLQESP